MLIDASLCVSAYFSCDSAHDYNNTQQWIMYNDNIVIDELCINYRMQSASVDVAGHDMIINDNALSHEIDQ